MVQGAVLIAFEVVACVVVAKSLALLTAIFVTAAAKMGAVCRSSRLRRRTKNLLRSHGVRWYPRRFVEVFTGPTPTSCPFCKDTVVELTRDRVFESYGGEVFSHSEALGFCCLRCGLVSSNVFLSDSWMMVEQLVNQ